MSLDQKFYITTAIAYANSAPHMGHAMEFILTDAIARYKRMMSYDTFFLTGTDEHGVKIYNTALKNDLKPQELVDQNADVFKNLKGLLGLSNDDFIQTTDKERHWPAAQKLWNVLVDKGDIYEKEYEGLYCEGCETFMKEKDLVDGKCAIHKKEPSIVKETNYFFRLSKYSEKIVELIESGEVQIVPDFRKNEFLNIAKEGLHDVSFSRSREALPWGIDVPNDSDQVMYVWCDALTNYISAIGYAKDTDQFKKYWPADMHVIGKDIVRFHAGIWLGMLLSADLPLPKSILIHGFVTYNGEKMSKSLGNVVDPIAIVDEYGLDSLRHYLLREIPLGKDGDFTDELFIERYNAHLANNLGNLVNRIHTLISRNEISDFSFDVDFESYKEEVDRVWKKYISDMNDYNIHEAMLTVWELVDFANKTMEETKPWALMKEDKEKGIAVLSNLLEVLRHISILVSPFIPTSSQKIRNIIGLSESIDLEGENGWGSVKGWACLGEKEILFPRIEIEK